MNFIETIGALGNNIWLYGVPFILILSLLVFIHEWGHYIVARMCGIKVEVFSIGFGREIAGFNDRNGTRWKFSLIPLGGYVKLFGDIDPASAKHSDMIEDSDTGTLKPLSEDEKKVAFFAQPLSARAAVVFAGPAINYIFAIIVMAIMFTWTGQPATPPSAAAIIEGSSADRHGFMPHDDIVSIDGHEIRDFEDIRREMMIALDEERHFIVERNGEKVDIFARPDLLEEEDRFGFKHSRGLLGLISPRHAINLENIKAVNGQGVDNVQAVRNAVQNRIGSVFTVTIPRSEGEDRLIIQPLKAFNETLSDPQAPEYNYLYIADKDANIMVRYTPGEAALRSLQETWSVTIGTLKALGQIIGGTRSATELGGVVRIGALAGDVVQQGLISAILFTALLSINLGLINLFPIPLLDGGHLLFYAFEAVLGKPIPDQIQEYAFRFGLAFLVGIMAYANLNDIVQLIL